MENNPPAQNQDARISKADLLTRIDRSLAELNKTLDGLTELQLTAPGPEKWSVKDHLAHLSVWESGIAELLMHRDRFAVMGVNEISYRTKSGDELNELIYQQQVRLTLNEVKANFQESHRRLLDALASLSDDDLYRPYAYYVSHGSHAPQGPVIDWIAGNSFEHYDLHNQYIKSLLQSLH